MDILLIYFILIKSSFSEDLMYKGTKYYYSSNDKKISLRFSNDFFFQWIKNLWKKESIEKQNDLFIF